MHLKRRIAIILIVVFLLFWPSKTTNCGYPLKGRFYVPSVGIDVALYTSNKQSVVDAEDSAALFSLSYRPNVSIIADHNIQAFASMTDIVVGDIAYIEWENEETTYLTCVEVLEGHNIGHGLTDDHGVNVVGPHPYITYTCKDYWRNIIICQWDISDLPPQ